MKELVKAIDAHVDLRINNHPNIAEDVLSQNHQPRTCQSSKSMTQPNSHLLIPLFNTYAFY